MCYPNNWTLPATTDFQAFFIRDFNYAPADDLNNLEYITNTDITNAINEAAISFNPGLGFGTNAQITNVFMYLVAFVMVQNLQNSSKGISSQSKFPISANSVGGVSVSYALPDKYRTDPILSSYTQNGYGMKYLTLVMPYLIGRINVEVGTTTYT